jgi:hypothetical protein
MTRDPIPSPPASTRGASRAASLSRAAGQRAGQRPWPSRVWPWAGPWLLLAACAHPAGSVAPTLAPAAWIDDPLLGSPPAEVDVLAGLAAGDPRARVVRLDRLLDLYDAARFGQDQDARETLWAALGGYGIGVGERASREASERLLQDALALDEAARRGGDDDTAAFAADAITLLSADLQPPATADDLSIRTLVYRTLAEQGHPRLGDNARWRIYDHVRGTLTAAVERPPAERLDVAVQALYAERDSVEDLLAEKAPHVRPPSPSADALWELVQAQATPLRAMPRWAPVVRLRGPDDQALLDTLRASLPTARRDDWPLPSFPAGTARAESLAPVAWIHDGQLVVDAGRPAARSVSLEADAVALAEALGNALAQDGRGTMLLVADPRLPAPQLHATLQALFRAKAERIELAVTEPRVAPASGRVVTALPLHVTHSAGQRAGDRAWAEARVHVHLDGRGPRVALDGHWLASQAPTDAAGLRALVEQIARAYPRERGVVLTLGADVQLQQLLDVLVALQGGPERPFTAVGFMADGARPPEGRSQGSSGGDVRLARRLALDWSRPRVELEQPYPLQAQDQARLEGFAKGLAACLPELEAERAPAQLVLVLRFDEGRLREAELPRTKRPKPGVAAVIDCVRDEGYALRLREHREALTATVTLAPTLRPPVPGQ